MTAGRVAVTLLSLALLASCSLFPGGQPTSPATVTVTAPASAATTPTTTSAPATTAPASTVPAKTTPTVVATVSASGPWVLTVNGLGPLVLGTKYSVLQAQGYVTAPNGECEASRTSQALQDKGVFLYPSGMGANAVLSEISIGKPTYTTLSGAKVGDTMKTLKQLYGTQLTTETKNGNGGPFKVAHVKVGTREVVFYFPYGSALVDTDVVQTIIARPYSIDMMGEC